MLPLGEVVAERHSVAVPECEAVTVELRHCVTVPEPEKEALGHREPEGEELADRQCEAVADTVLEAEGQ